MTIDDPIVPVPDDQEETADATHDEGWRGAQDDPWQPDEQAPPPVIDG